MAFCERQLGVLFQTMKCRTREVLVELIMAGPNVRDLLNI